MSARAIGVGAVNDRDEDIWWIIMGISATLLVAAWAWLAIR